MIYYSETNKKGIDPLDIRDLIVNEWHSTGVVPTVEAIATHFEISSSTTHYHLMNMVERGILRREEARPGSKRFTFVPPEFPTHKQLVEAWLACSKEDASI
jgi:predicted transcriptional regulator